VKKKVLDQQTLDEAMNKLKAAEAALNEAKAKVPTLQATLELDKLRRDQAANAVEIGQATLEEAKAEYQEQLAWLDYATLRAPFDGIVTRRMVGTGDFLPAATLATAGKATEAFVVMRIDRVRVVLQVPERDAPFVKDGADAIVRLPVKDQEIACKLTRSAWSLDPENRTLRVEIHLDNPKQELRPGTSANVSIPAEDLNALTLPADAILTDEDGFKYCFTVENGKATRLRIRVGTSDKGRIEVRTKMIPPVKPGEKTTWVKFTGTEQVIVSDVRSLKDGQPVKVK
jgi:RND family efflux transporter MFP subunit